VRRSAILPRRGADPQDSRAWKRSSPPTPTRRLLGTISSAPARDPRAPRSCIRGSSAELFRELLQNILNVNLTLETKTLSEVSNRQNEEVKKISAWAAILFAPSIVGTVYGMNFDHMPELKWLYGYPFALGLMVAVGAALYLAFQTQPLDLTSSLAAFGTERHLRCPAQQWRDPDSNRELHDFRS
jgi:hypothetical protein